MREEGLPCKEEGNKEGKKAPRRPNFSSGKLPLAMAPSHVPVVGEQYSRRANQAILSSIGLAPEPSFV